MAPPMHVQVAGLDAALRVTKPLPLDEQLARVGLEAAARHVHGPKVTALREVGASARRLCRVRERAQPGACIGTRRRSERSVPGAYL